MSCSGDCGPIVVTLLTGAPGVQGEQGVQGPVGPQGPQGPQGPAGGVGSITGDISISTDSVASLVTVGVAAITGSAAQALTLQTDAKGRVLAVTAQAISVTTSQVQNLSLATLGGVATTDPRLSDSRTPSGAAGGDLAGTYPNPTLGAVGTAGVTGATDKTLILQTDSKGRVLAATAQAISVTTSQVQNLSLSTLGGVATTDSRLSDARVPTGDAGGDLAGTYPAPTLVTVGTAGVIGSADKTLLLQTDAKGRVLAATAQAISVTTEQVQNLSLATLGGVSTTDPRLSDARTPSGAAGGDLSGTYPNPTLGTVTTAGSAGSATVVPVVTIDAKGRVTSLTSAQIAALTTAQVAGLSTATPAAIATTGAVGVEMFAARADHVHALTTLGAAGVFGSGSAVPVVTVDAFGRVASVTTAEISGGVALTTSAAAPLGAIASAGSSALAARGDHVHALPTAAEVGAIATTGNVKLSINTSLTTAAGINLAPLASAPATPTAGDVWVRGNVLEFAGTGSTVACVGNNQNNTYGGIQTFQNRISIAATVGSALTVTQGGGGTSSGAIVTGATNSGVPLVRVTQTGAGDALVVEDSTNPDATPFTVNATGRVGIGLSVATTETAALTVDAGGIKFSDGSLQTAFVAALTTAQIAGLSTATPAALSTTGAVGVSLFVARADHVHALSTLGVAGTFGSASAIPVVTVDAFGRVASVTTAGITGGGGASLTTADAAPLGALASAGVSSLAARGDHIHPLPTAAQVGAIATTGTVKLSINTSLSTAAALSLAPLAVAPATPSPGDIWVRGNILEFAGTGSTVATLGSNQNNTYTGVQTFSNRVTVTATSGSALTVTQGGGGTSSGAIVTGATNSGVPLMRVTQTGAGDALVVEDSANPDSTPFTVNAAGRVGIGLSVATTETAALTVDAGGIKFADGTLQTTAIGALTTAGLASLNSPAFTGIPTAPTASAGTNTTQIATTAFVQTNAGDKYKTTSNTAATIANGTQTFTVASGLSYTATQDVTIVANVSNHMHGTVTSYSGTTLVVDVSQHTGSGTFSSWTINVGGVVSGGGASLTTEPAYALATAGVAGLSTEAARADHQHPIGGDVAPNGTSGNVTVQGVQNTQIVGNPYPGGMLGYDVSQSGIVWAAPSGDVAQVGSGILNLEVQKLRGQEIAETTPVQGNALVYDGASWTPTNLNVPSAATANPLSVSTVSQVGTSEKFAREDHVHTLEFFTYLPEDLKTEPIEGTSSYVARADHAHAIRGDVVPDQGAVGYVRVNRLLGGFQLQVPGNAGALYWPGYGNDLLWEPMPSVPGPSDALAEGVGTASAGSSNEYSRADHSHAIQGDIIDDPNQAGSTLVYNLQRYPVNAYSPANNTVLQFQNGAWAPVDYKSYINNAISYLNTAFSANLPLIP